MDQQEKVKRRCIAPDCTTMLSRYNSDHLCFAHADEASQGRFAGRWITRTSPAWYHQSGRSSTRAEVAPAVESWIVALGSVEDAAPST